MSQDILQELTFQPATMQTALVTGYDEDELKFWMPLSRLMEAAKLENYRARFVTQAYFKRGVRYQIVLHMFFLGGNKLPEHDNWTQVRIRRVEEPPFHDQESSDGILRFYLQAKEGRQKETNLDKGESGSKRPRKEYGIRVTSEYFIHQLQNGSGANKGFLHKKRWIVPRQITEKWFPPHFRDRATLSVDIDQLIFAGDSSNNKDLEDVKWASSDAALQLGKKTNFDRKCDWVTVDVELHGKKNTKPLSKEERNEIFHFIRSSESESWLNKAIFLNEVKVGDENAGRILRAPRIAEEGIDKKAEDVLKMLHKRSS